MFTTGPWADYTFLGRNNLGYKGAGHYIGINNRTVRIVGDSHNQDLYVTRVIAEFKDDDGAKHKVYQETNMTHLTEMNNTIFKSNVIDDHSGGVISCMDRLYVNEV